MTLVLAGNVLYRVAGSAQPYKAKAPIIIAGKPGTALVLITPQRGSASPTWSVSMARIDLSRQHADLAVTAEASGLVGDQGYVDLQQYSVKDQHGKDVSDLVTRKILKVITKLVEKHISRFKKAQ